MKPKGICNERPLRNFSWQPYWKILQSKYMGNNRNLRCESLKRGEQGKADASLRFIGGETVNFISKSIGALKEEKQGWKSVKGAECGNFQRSKGQVPISKRWERKISFHLLGHCVFSLWMDKGNSTLSFLVNQDCLVLVKMRFSNLTDWSLQSIFHEGSKPHFTVGQA